MAPVGIVAARATAASIRVLERETIAEFVTSCSEHLTGRVLDYGCGKQPYRPIIEAAGGVYFGFDRSYFPANVSRHDVGYEPQGLHLFDAIVCTQVIQYVAEPARKIIDLRGRLVPGGHLLITWPTGWEEVESQDLWRFTVEGMRRLLSRDRGFEPLRVEQRAVVDVGGFLFPLGGAALARAF